MSKIRLYGDTSGYVDLTAPAVADNRSIDLPGVLDSKLDLAGGKILQVVRATDSTRRETTSQTYVDTGLSVTITPQKSDSAIVLIYSATLEAFQGVNTTVAVFVAITDSSNNTLSGAENGRVSNIRYTYSSPSGVVTATTTTIGYSTPATTSATTYKVRFHSDDTNTTARLRNDENTGQLYAIEVSA